MQLSMSVCRTKKVRELIQSWQGMIDEYEFWIEEEAVSDTTSEREELKRGRWLNCIWWWVGCWGGEEGWKERWGVVGVYIWDTGGERCERVISRRGTRPSWKAALRGYSDRSLFLFPNQIIKKTANHLYLYLYLYIYTYVSIGVGFGSIWIWLAAACHGHGRWPEPPPSPVFLIPVHCGQIGRGSPECDARGVILVRGSYL